MYTALMVFHAVISVLLIVLVLLQFGKGAEAGLISGGASDAVFTGSQQGNILSKATAVLSVIFMLNSIFLARIQSNKTSSSLLDGEVPVAAPLNQDMAMPSTGEKAEGEKAEGTKDAPKAESTPAQEPAAKK